MTEQTARNTDTPVDAADVTAISVKTLARNIKRDLYDFNPALCRQPLDHYLNTVLDQASAKYGPDRDAVMLGGIVAFEANASKAASEIALSKNPIEAGQYAKMEADLRLLHDEMGNLRVLVRS